MTEFARQLSANDDVIFVYALLYSNDIWSMYFYDNSSIKMQKFTALISVHRLGQTALG